MFVNMGPERKTEEARGTFRAKPLPPRVDVFAKSWPCPVSTWHLILTPVLQAPDHHLIDLRCQGTYSHVADCSVGRSLAASQRPLHKQMFLLCKNTIIQGEGDLLVSDSKLAKPDTRPDSPLPIPCDELPFVMKDSRSVSPKEHQWETEDLT